MRHKIIIWTVFFLGFTGLAATFAMAGAGRGAGVPFEALPGELKGMEIKDYFVPSPSFKGVGVIHALNGHVVVIHKATGTAYFGREGDRVYENDSLTSLADSRCRIKFFQEVIHTFPLIFSLKESELVLVTLSLVDMALVGGLLVMVMLSGYENFVSAIDLEEGQEKLSWLGTELITSSLPRLFWLTN